MLNQRNLGEVALGVYKGKGSYVFPLAYGAQGFKASCTEVEGLGVHDLGPSTRQT